MSSSLFRTVPYVLSLLLFLLLSGCATAPQQQEPPRRSPQDGREPQQEHMRPGAQEERTPAGQADEPQETGRAGLSGAEIFRRSRETVPDRFLFIEQEGAPVTLFHDLDGNGYMDAMYLLVERSDSLAEGLPERFTQLPEPASSEDAAPGDGETPEEAPAAQAEGAEEGESAQQRREKAKRELLESWYARGMVPREAISSVSRIYSKSVQPVDYYLSVFLQTGDELISMYRIPLGSWKVFDSFETVEIVERSAMPYCVSSSFQTAEGKERIWVIFSRYNKFSTFTISDTVSEHTVLRDINSNGVLDVVRWSQIFEEGTGYETFLTWYRWNGLKYVQHESANVVRSLNSFLSQAGRLLQAGLWEEAFSHMMSPADYRRYRDEGYDYSELFELLFTGEAAAESAADGGSAGPEDGRRRGDQDNRRGDQDNGGEREERRQGDLRDGELESAAVQAAGREGTGQEGRDRGPGPAELIAGEGGERAFKLVVFPRIMENPFRRYVETGEGPPYRVKLAVRFSSATGGNFVRYCKVQMHRNPFSSPQFFLVPEY